MRRPTGESGVGSGLRWASARERLVAIGLEKVHAQIDGRPLGERPALLRSGSAEARLQLLREPFGEISNNVRGRARKVGSRKPLAFGFGELCRRVALAGEQSGDRLGVEAVRLSQRAQHFGARTGTTHDPGGRAFLTQRVIDEARYRRPIARACEAMRQAPIFHRVGRGSATGFDVGENFDRGGGAGGGNHGMERPVVA